MPVSKKRTKEIEAIKDKDINYTDIPELDDSFFALAERHMPHPKKSVTMRLDDDVLDWFKKHGRGYQSRMNAILRAYMEVQQEHKGK